LQFLAGFEPHRFAGGDADFLAGARVAADTGLARADAENAEAAQFNAITCRESLFEPLEYGIHGSFSLGSRQACPLNDVMDNILLDQCRSPLLDEYFAAMRNGPLAGCYWELATLSIFAYSNTIRHLGAVFILHRLSALPERLRGELRLAEREYFQCPFKMIAGFGNRHSSTA
jgi:hypothetical protein